MLKVKIAMPNQEPTIYISLFAKYKKTTMADLSIVDTYEGLGYRISK
jgi:hypothetical protein